MGFKISDSASDMRETAGPGGSRALTYRQVLSLAWPIMLAQIATAMTGVVDTAVIGRYDDRVGLAAVAVAAVAFSFIYWGFGFLRMATTGLTSQAIGRQDFVESRRILARALILGAGFGIVLLLGSPLLGRAIFAAFGATDEVEGLAREYFLARIPGAPAALMGYGIMGWLIGVGRTRALLAYQVVANGTNVVLDITFVASFDLGPAGVGAGTAIAEWVALIFGVWLLRKELGELRRPRALLEPARVREMLVANRDVMIRTLALLFSFAWFINSGASVGTAALAGNQVLLQFV
ncbi:MAG: MATE family multidrug resistance protein, partial [Myxococcota bacterium]